MLRSTGPRRQTGSAWRRRVLAVTAAASVAAAPAIALLPASPASADAVRDTENWVLSELNVEQAWQVTEGHGVVVAVIDSGVDGDIPDLQGSVESRQPDDSGVQTLPSDANWGVHGTWMASLIAGHGHPGSPDTIGSSGIVGVAPESTVLSIRVITDPLDPDYAEYQHEPAAKGQRELAKAIKYAVGHGAEVISMSLGYSQQSRVVRAALQVAYRHNVVVVASAGNSGGTSSRNGSGQAPYSFPANYPGVLAVGAVNSASKPTSFSSENESVQVAAPGWRVPAAGRDGQYWYVSGTSPACALTAGVAALIKSKYPNLTDPQVISAITSSTTPSTRPAGGYNQRIGFGVVNAGAALTKAAQLAAARPPARVAAATHFGGGVRAIPVPPVAPRGQLGLLLYCLLGAACLAFVALATSRLLALRDASGYQPAVSPSAVSPPAAWPAGGRPPGTRPPPAAMRSPWAEDPDATLPGVAWRPARRAAGPEQSDTPPSARYTAPWGPEHDGHGPA